MSEVFSRPSVKTLFWIQFQYCYRIECLNPFKPNGISHYYQLDQYISVLRDVGSIFHFYSNFNLTFCKQLVETLIRRRVLRRLIWVCTVCSMSHKKDARLIWVKMLVLCTKYTKIIEPWHEISNNVVCATEKTRKFLSLTRGCTGSS